MAGGDKVQAIDFFSRKNDEIQRSGYSTLTNLEENDFFSICQYQR